MNEAYKFPDSEIHTYEQVKYAGFWIRLLASVIDSIWMLPFVVGVGFVYYGAGYLDSDETYKGAFDIFIQYLLPLVLTLSFWIVKSATPGKMALKIKIVSAKDYSKASSARLLLRYLAYYVSMIFLFIGFFWVAFDKRKQGWHDKIAGTLVVYS